MQTPHALFRYVGKSLLNILPYAAYGVPLPVGDFAFEVVPALMTDVWAKLFQGDSDADRRATIEALARLTNEEAARLAAEVGADPEIPEERRGIVEGYLREIPPSVRATLRRPADPTGSTLPARRVPQSAEDLAGIFPARLPRFRPGDRPGGIDRELIRCLGVGGFGEVWLAFNPNKRSKPPVALKIAREDAADLLRNEIEILDRLEAQADALHPGIVRLIDTHLGADPPSLDYEYVEGFELTVLIRDWHSEGNGQGPDPVVVATMVRDLAEIVGSAHRLAPAVVHRDLKPANILVVPKPGGGHLYRITDFGIGGLAAKRELSRASLGGAASRGASLVGAARGAYTPLYSPLRQMNGASPHPRDDLHALGVIWYQALTGDLRAGCPTGSRWKARLIERGMAPPLVELLESCFEDDLDSDANALAASLTQLLQPRPAVPDPPPTPTPPRPEPEPAARPEARPGFFQRLDSSSPKPEAEPPLSSASAYFERALKKYAAGDHAAAVRDYDRAIELDPKYAIAYSRRGIARSSLGDHAAAVRDYDRAIELDPNLAIACHSRGWARYNLGVLDAAVRDYDRAIELDPKYADAYHNRGNSYRRLGQFDRALRDVNKSLELRPGFALSHAVRGAIYRRMGDFSRAQADLQEALHIRPDYPFAKDQLERVKKQDRS